MPSESDVTPTIVSAATEHNPYLTIVSTLNNFDNTAPVSAVSTANASDPLASTDTAANSVPLDTTSHIAVHSRPIRALDLIPTLFNIANHCRSLFL